jgi:hypothetical protein
MEAWFIILIIIVIAELIMSGRWFPFYFRTGIPLFRRSFSFLEQPTISPETLSEKFHSSFIDPLLFRAIGPHEIGFREKFLSFRLFNYTPVMHGLIRVDQLQHKVTVIGYANWFVIFFAATFIAIHLPFAQSEVHYLPLSIVVFIYLAILYVIQTVRFNRIFKTLEKKYK